LSDCRACGRRTYQTEWCAAPECSGCRRAVDLCDCQRLTAAAPAGDSTEPGLAELARIASRYAAVNWHDAWKAQPAEIEWLIEPFLEAGTVNALFGPPGTGKSLLTLEIALRLVREGRTIVYVDDENRVNDLVERLQAFGATPGELDRLQAYSFAGLPPLDTTGGGLHLLAIAATANAHLVVLDTTSRMVQGKENDADTYLQLYRHTMIPLKTGHHRPPARPPRQRRIPRATRLVRQRRRRRHHLAHPESHAHDVPPRADQEPERSRRTVHRTAPPIPAAEARMGCPRRVRR
jgi:hypothetical protein